MKRGEKALSCRTGWVRVRRVNTRDAGREVLQVGRYTVGFTVWPWRACRGMGLGGRVPELGLPFLLAINVGGFWRKERIMVGS